MASSFLRFLDHTQRRTTIGRTPLDEWSARRRDLYLTTHNTHNRQTSMPPVGFEPTISVGERPQTYDLDRAATGTGKFIIIIVCNIITSYQGTCWKWHPSLRHTWYVVIILLKIVVPFLYRNCSYCQRAVFCNVILSVDCLYKLCLSNITSVSSTTKRTEYSAPQILSKALI